MALGDATSSWEQFLDSPLLPLEDLVSSPPRSKRTHAEAFPMSGAIRSSPILLVCHDTLCFTTYHLPNLSLFVSRADFLYPSHLQPMTRNQRPHLSPAPILLPLLLRMNPPLRCHPTRQQHMDVLLGLCSLQQLRKPLRPVQAASDYLLLSQIFHSRRLAGSNYERALAIVEQFGGQEVYVYAMGQEPWLNHVMGLKYTDQSRPIVESNKLIETCRSRGITCERLYGEKTILLP